MAHEVLDRDRIELKDHQAAERVPQV